MLILFILSAMTLASTIILVIKLRTDVTDNIKRCFAGYSLGNCALRDYMDSYCLYGTSKKK